MVTLGDVVTGVLVVVVKKEEAEEEEEEEEEEEDEGGCWGGVQRWFLSFSNGYDRHCH